jgi:probable HAF family extracellular repeat protein
MRSKLCVHSTVLLSISVASVRGPAQAAAPTIYNLGILGGMRDSIGSSINNSGQVAGWSNTGVPTESRASLYTGTPGSGGVMHDLGTLGGTFSFGQSINDSGQVAGHGQLADNVTYHAFRYTGTPSSGGVMHDLGTLGGNFSYGFGINSSGQITGLSSTADAETHAFRYTGTPGNGGVMHDLGTLGGTSSNGLAVNNNGHVTGWSGTASSSRHAFLYAGTPGSGGSMVDLGTLGGTESIGRAINGSGQIVGWSEIPGNVATHAFLYTGTPGAGGHMIDLGTLGGSLSQAYDINDAGQVVGYSAYEYCACDPGGDPEPVHAFLYTGTPGVDGLMIDLDAWLDANNPAEGAKWTLESASGLNDAGLITGTGFYNDGYEVGLSDGVRAFVLDASSLLVPPDLPGDLNLDGNVDAADYVVWRKSPSSFGGSGGYNTWRSNFGRTSGIGLAASENPVPEPGTLALLTLAVPALLRRRQAPAVGPVRPRYRICRVYKSATQS